MPLTTLDTPRKQCDATQNFANPKLLGGNLNLCAYFKTCSEFEDREFLVKRTTHRPERWISARKTLTNDAFTTNDLATLLQLYNR